MSQSPSHRRCLIVLWWCTQGESWVETFQLSSGYYKVHSKLPGPTICRVEPIKIIRETNTTAIPAPDSPTGLEGGVIIAFTLFISANYN